MSHQKNVFKSLYIVQFLASWTATRYDEACMRGTQNELETPPVEDAEHLAEEAWKEMLDKEITFII